MYGYIYPQIKFHLHKLAFGLNHSNGAHKQVYNVFKKIDTAESQQATEFAKGILGISDWSSVIRQH